MIAIGIEGRKIITYVSSRFAYHLPESFVNIFFILPSHADRSTMQRHRYTPRSTILIVRLSLRELRRTSLEHGDDILTGGCSENSETRGCRKR